MGLTQRDHPIETIAPCRFDPTLSDAILLGRPDARSHNLHARPFQRIHLAAEFRVPIHDDVLVRARRIWERLAELPAHPFGGRMRGHVEMEDPATVMSDHEKALQQAESHRWHGEEVHGGNGLVVILQEGRPSAPGNGRRCVRKHRSRASITRRESWARPRTDSRSPCVRGLRGHRCLPSGGRSERRANAPANRAESRRDASQPPYPARRGSRRRASGPRANVRPPRIDGRAVSDATATASA